MGGALGPALGVVLLWGVLLALASGLGGPHGAAVGLARALEVIAVAGLPALAYVLAGVGLGRALSFLWTPRAGVMAVGDGLALQAAAGTAVLLSLSHLLGVLGLFAGAAGRVVALGPVVIGLGVLAQQALGALRAGQREGQRGGADDGLTEARGEAGMPGARRPRAFVARLALAAALAPGGAIMLVAACSPPGALWSSEFGGYDALSYHLPLVQEWLSRGRLTPVEHNVYSFLPSYVEAAFLHVAVMTGATGPSGVPADAGRAWGLLAGDGVGALGAQLLHAWLGLLSAWLVARLVAVVLRDALAGGADEGTLRAGADAIAGAERRADRLSSLMAGLAPALVPALAGGLFLATPWVQVVGSLAYNELAVAALGAGALLAAWDRALRAGPRAALCALLVGVACGAKPSSLVLVAPGVAVVFLLRTPVRAWAVAVPVGLACGFVALLPWLVRNHLASGNPVFPFASSVFGPGHWSAEQLDRYARAHRFDGSILDALRLLVVADPADPAGPRHRGLGHAQWGYALPLLALGATVAGAAVTRTRALALALGGALLVTLAAWALFTHVQSRFLLPAGVLMAALVAVPGALTMAGVRGRVPLLGALGLALLVQCLVAWGVYARERGGQPAALLLAGPGVFTGEAFRDELGTLPPSEQRTLLNNLPAEAWVNLVLPRLEPGSRVLLVGDATPFYLSVPTLYTTTWDRSLLAAAMAANPTDSASWAEALRARGVTHVLINPGEIDRLSRTGWADADLTPARVELFARTQLTPIMAWQSPPQLLGRLQPPTATSPATAPASGPARGVPASGAPAGGAPAGGARRPAP